MGKLIIFPSLTKRRSEYRGQVLPKQLNNPFFRNCVTEQSEINEVKILLRVLHRLLKGINFSAKNANNLLRLFVAILVIALSVDQGRVEVLSDELLKLAETFVHNP